MSTETAVAPSVQHVKDEIDKKTIIEYLDAFGLSKELTDQEKKRFIQIAISYNLNPFRREVYCVPYGYGENRRLSILTGYEVYLKRAERTGQLDGWRAFIEGSGEDTRAVVEIWRKDWSKPFVHQVFWKEAAQRKSTGELTSFWKKQPRFQLKKVAISQAFRMCFPDELGGMCYDAAELPEEMSTNTNPSKQTTQSDPTKPVNSKKAPTVSGSNTIQFPSERNVVSDSPQSTSDEAQGLKELIKAMLSKNGLLFPKAHQDWIEKELENDPDETRLEEIVSHMQSVIGDDNSHESEITADQVKEPCKELIF